VLSHEIPVPAPSVVRGCCERKTNPQQLSRDLSYQPSDQEVYAIGLCVDRVSLMKFPRVFKHSFGARKSVVKPKVLLVVPIFLTFHQRRGSMRPMNASCPG
jgi:hypothetical protein